MFIIYCYQDKSYCLVEDKAVIYDKDNVSEGDEVTVMYSNKKYQGRVHKHSDDVESLEETFKQLQRAARMKKSKPSNEDTSGKKESLVVRDKRSCTKRQQPIIEQIAKKTKLSAANVKHQANNLDQLKDQNVSKLIEQSKSKASSRDNTPHKTTETEESSLRKQSKSRVASGIQASGNDEINSSTDKVSGRHSPTKEELKIKLQEALARLNKACAGQDELSDSRPKAVEDLQRFFEESDHETNRESEKENNRAKLRDNQSSSSAVNCELTTSSPQSSTAGVYELQFAENRRSLTPTNPQTPASADQQSPILENHRTATAASPQSRASVNRQSSPQAGQNRESSTLDESDEDDQLYGRFWNEKMTHLKDGVYCKKQVLDAARGRSHKASHLARQLIRGVIKDDAILNCTLTGQASRKHKQENQGKIRCLNEKAKEALIEYSRDYAKLKGWTKQSRRVLQGVLTQRIGEIKREIRKAK